ncbi:MAG TPA: hypothetical protein VFY16_08590 [Gemmatimonadaceae bacterium]|nr:hypothetical protein [Gemmatimonadaceae bacterium]
MLALLVAAQIAVVAPALPAESADSVYESPELRAFVTDAAERNRRAPAALDAYAARVESEMAFIALQSDGSEGVATLEQVASRLTWERPGVTEQHVVGYRTRSVGLSVSALALFDHGWVVPVLYGNRMSLFFGRDTSARRARSRSRPRRGVAVHPLAEDRERVYRYAGGDTVATIQVSGRTIPIVRVEVTPRRALDRRTLVFRGALFLDATQGHLVRMRGEFLVVGGERRLRDRLQRATLQAVAFVELENQEVHGRYWLPAYQRVELQSGLAFVGDARGVFRLVSRVRDVAVREGAGAPAADTLVPLPRALTFAPRDSLDDYRAWTAGLGEATAQVSAGDFGDVAPDALRPTGPPRLDVRVERTADLLRFNRVEGPFTGAGVIFRFRDRAPGVALTAAAGWAWSEETPRGRLTLERQRGAPWRWGARLERRLDITNDFLFAFDSGGSATPSALLFSRDDYDYVDRRLAGGWVERDLIGAGARRVLLRVESAAGHDGAPVPNRSRGLWIADSGFRGNRPVREGDYLRTRVTLRANPAARADLVRPGVGAQLRYERGDGQLQWQRAEAQLDAVAPYGPWLFAARLDGGALLGPGRPPQQLFELGGTQRLPGYDYKELTGDQAAAVAGAVLYGLPVLQAPIRFPVPILRRRLLFPGIAPMLAASVESGWVGVTEEARAAVAALPPPAAGVEPLVLRGTDDVRTTVELGLRFFGGAVGIGMARAVDHGEAWRFTWRLGGAF